MKRVLFVAVVCAMVFGSCSNVQRENELTAENDSLQQVINDRDAEIDEIVGTVNLIQEGFNRINEAEGRITVDNSSLENVGKRQAVVENMEFIEQSLAQNREMIARLKEQLEESKVGGEKLQRMVDNLQAQLDNQTLRVQELEAILAERDNNKEYVLQIVDVDKFWSVSKYLVIQVK